MPRLSFRDRVAEYFRDRPGQWVDGRTLETIGGVYAWRTRLSECRRDLGMELQNRQRTIRKDDGSQFVVSEYRYQPPISRVIDLSAVKEQRLF